MSRRILLADDSVTIQKVVELTFMDEDYEVTSASDGDEAIERLDQGRPDIVIADVHMPGPSGYDIARQVKERHPEVPVLLLVGTFEPFDEEEVAESGADGFLKKPFDSQELLRRVAELLGTGATDLDADWEPAAEPEGLSDVEVALDAELGGAEWSEAEEWAEEAWDGGGRGEAREAEAPAEPGASPAESEAAWRPAEPRHAPAPPGETGEAAPVAASHEAPGGSGEASGEALALSEQDVDRIAHRVVELLSEKAVREVAWEIIPDLAEVVIKDRLRELESEVE